MFYIINFGSTKTPQIAGMLSELGERSEVLAWDGVDDVDFTHCEGIVFSGSPTYLTEVDHGPYIKRYQFIRSGAIPVLGICFGHQVMGLIHQSEIYRGAPVREPINIHINKEDRLFRDIPNPARMVQDHTEGITLPSNFVHLATSATYSIEAMRHPMLPLYGVQFHPEVSGDNGKILFRNFRDICRNFSLL